jgi:hypothetical protein
MKPQRPAYASSRSRAKPLKPAQSHRKDLIRLNTSALRKKALQSHRKAEKALARLKDQLKRYHEQDIPGFRSWVHRTFGHLLTRQRELQHAFEEKRTFVYEIQEMADRYRLSELDAYRKVLWRRAHPDEAQEEDRLYEEAERQRQESRANAKQSGSRDLNDIFGDDAFEDDPDDEWGDIDDFFETLTRDKLKSRDSSPPDQKSVKELYRNIVRQLHPDRHGQMTDARKALWHEAQEAYRRHDLNALHSILSRCDSGEAALGDHSPVSLIHRLTRQLKATAQSTKNEMRNRRRDVAWDYETRIRNPRYVQDVKADLQGMVDNLQWSLDEIEGELARLSRLATRQARHPARTGRM